MGSDGHGRAALPKHAAPAPATPETRSERTLEYDARAAPPPCRPQIGVHGVADEGAIQGDEHGLVGLEQPRSQREDEDVARSAAERGASRRRRDPAAVVPVHPVETRVRLAVVEAGDVRVVACAGRRAQLTTPMPTEGREPRGICRSIETAAPAFEPQVCAASGQKAAAFWVLPSQRGGNRRRTGRQESIIPYVRDAGLDVGRDLRAYGTTVGRRPTRAGRPQRRSRSGERRRRGRPDTAVPGPRRAHR